MIYTIKYETHDDLFTKEFDSFEEVSRFIEPRLGSEEFKLLSIATTHPFKEGVWLPIEDLLTLPIGQQITNVLFKSKEWACPILGMFTQRGEGLLPRSSRTTIHTTGIAKYDAIEDTYYDWDDMPIPTHFLVIPELYK